MGLMHYAYGPAYASSTIFYQLPQAATPATGTEDRATTKDGEESGRDQEFYSQIWLKECHF